MTGKGKPPAGGGRTGRRCIRWTPEEDKILRDCPGWMTAAQIQKTLHKATGIHRNGLSVSDRRRLVNPDYDLEPPGWIRLSEIAGQGADGRVINPAAIRAATEANAMRRITIHGVKHKVVTMKFADEWIAQKQRERDEYQHAIDNDWLTTRDIAIALNKPYPAFHGWLRRAFTDGNSIYKAFAGITRVKGFRNEQYWEPTATRAAIAIIQEHARRSKALKRHLWSAKKVADYLNVHPQTIHDRRGRFRGLDLVPHERNHKGWCFWYPEAVIAFARSLENEEAA